jgi:hypothetical protein
VSARKTTRTKRTTKRAARPAARRRDRDFTARLVDRLRDADVDVVPGLRNEEIGEGSRVRRGLDDPRDMLVALAADLGGKGDAYGPVLLGSAVVRGALDAAWVRARMGSREDAELLAAIGAAFVDLKRHVSEERWVRPEREDARLRPVSEDLKALVSNVKNDLILLDSLLPRDAAEARRYGDPVFLDECIRERSRNGTREEVNAMTLLIRRPAVVGLLIEARATKNKHGVLAFGRLARAIVRPFASRDPADVKKNILAEKQRLKRSRRRKRPEPE